MMKVGEGEKTVVARCMTAREQAVSSLSTVSDCERRFRPGQIKKLSRNLIKTIQINKTFARKNI